jgi:hypothetical protein
MSRSSILAWQTAAPNTHNMGKEKKRRNNNMSTVVVVKVHSCVTSRKVLRA